MDIRKRRISEIYVLQSRELAMEAIISDPDTVHVLTAEEQKGRGKARIRFRCRSIQNAIQGEMSSLGQLLDPESGNVILKIHLDD